MASFGSQVPTPWALSLPATNLCEQVTAPMARTEGGRLLAFHGKHPNHNQRHQGNCERSELDHQRQRTGNAHGPTPFPKTGQEVNPQDGTHM